MKAHLQSHRRCRPSVGISPEMLPSLGWAALNNHVCIYVFCAVVPSLGEIWRYGLKGSVMNYILL